MLRKLVKRLGRSLLALPCAYMVGIFCLSHTPGHELPQWEIEGFSVGNLLHFPVYFGLSFLWLLTLTAWPAAARHVGILAVTLATTFGALDELHQWFVPLRTMDFWDGVVNFLGALCAALTWNWVRPLFFATPATSPVNPTRSLSAPTQL